MDQTIYESKVKREKKPSANSALLSKFNYEEAFSRNLGWVTEEEQQILRNKRVAVAGLGGVGGHYCEALARLGVSKFHIADFDEFELHNFNRQNGATIETVGLKKSEAIRRKILAINPEADVEVYPFGVNDENLQSFINNCDLYLDSIDFFVHGIREKLFAALRERDIPAITVAPVGMGAAMLVFTKKSMSFKNYFGLDSVDDPIEKSVLFATGLAPSLTHRNYLVDPTKVDFKNKKVPSTPMAIYMSTGLAVTNGLKLLLGRGSVPTAPTSFHFDAFNNVLKKRTNWLGYRNPWNLIRHIIIKRILKL